MSVSGGHVNNIRLLLTVTTNIYSNHVVCMSQGAQLTDQFETRRMTKVFVLTITLSDLKLLL